MRPLRFRQSRGASPASQRLRRQVPGDEPGQPREADLSSIGSAYLPRGCGVTHIRRQVPNQSRSRSEDPARVAPSGRRPPEPRPVDPSAVRPVRKTSGPKPGRSTAAIWDRSPFRRVERRTAPLPYVATEAAPPSDPESAGAFRRFPAFHPRRCLRGSPPGRSLSGRTLRGTAKVGRRSPWRQPRSMVGFRVSDRVFARSTPHGDQTHRGFATAANYTSVVSVTPPA